MNPLDLDIFRIFNSWVGVSPVSDFLVIVFSGGMGYPRFYVMLGLVVMLIFGLRNRSLFVENRDKILELLIYASASAFFARFVLTELIRFFYNRPRPFEALASINNLLYHPGGGSFPSGHAAFMFAVSTAFAFYFPRTSIIFFAVSLLMSVARIAGGVHWPSDILGGALVGVGTALLVRWVWTAYFRKKSATP